MFSLINTLFAIAGFFIIAVIINSVSTSLISLIIFPRFGMIVNEFSILGFCFRKTDDGANWEYSFFMQFPFSTVKYTNNVDCNNPEEKNSIERKMFLLRGLIQVAVSLLLLLTCVSLIINIINHRNLSFIGIFWLSICIGAVFHSFSYFIISLFSTVNNKSGLGAYINELQRRTENGVYYGQLSIAPLENIHGKKPTEIEILYYYLFCVFQFADLGRIEDMKNYSRKINLIIERKNYNSRYDIFYYWLIYFYSKYEYNPPLAEKYYKMVAHILEKDNDADGKRTMASYSFAIKKDRINARRYINEAIGSYERIKNPADRELQQRLIFELNEYFTRLGV